MVNLQDFSVKICFYFPYHEVSGVPVLFFRIANELAVSNKHNLIYIIDYKDGAIARNLINKSNIKLLPFIDGVQISPPKDAILVMQSILPYSIRSELKISPDTKLFFWNLHPDCLIPILFPLPYFRNLQNVNFKFYKTLSVLFFPSLIKNVSEFILQAISKKSLFFMDQSNLDKTNKYLFLDIPNINFLPVPAKSSHHKINNFVKVGSVLNMTWIGRLCDFKSHTLIYTIKKLSALAASKKIKLKYSIIGDGPFKKIISKLEVDNDWFKLELLGSLKPELLDNFLLNRTDVLTAMGTSALEGAKLGIPTVLLDISYSPLVNDYKFRWLHNSINYDLAHDITKKDLEKGNLSLSNMLDELTNNYDSVSKKAFDYFNNNHELNLVLEKFISNIRESNLKLSDINPAILKKSFPRRVYDFIRVLKRKNQY